MDPVTIKPLHSKHDVTGLAFYIQGRIYAHGARRLNRKSRKREWFDPVPYFLVCQSLELYLKSFIWHTDGVGWKTLKDRYRHDVPKLWQHAKDRGLGKYARATKDRNEVIALVGPYYRERRLSYLDPGMMIHGFSALRGDVRIVPTLLRLTRLLDRKLAPLWVRRKMAP